jgi:type VI protein secretion system component Hcp
MVAMSTRLSRRCALLLFASIAALGAAVPAPAIAATDVFVRIAELGPCGDSIADQFPGDIVALGFTEGVGRQVDEKTGLPTRSGKMERGLTLLKAVDGCSPLLFLATLTGQPLSVHAFFVQTGTEPQVVGEIIATDTLITSMTTDFKTTTLQEVVQLGIGGTLTVLRRTFNADGSPGPTVSRCWNFASNTAC